MLQSSLDLRERKGAVKVRVEDEKVREQKEREVMSVSSINRTAFRSAILVNKSIAVCALFHDMDSLCLLGSIHAVVGHGSNKARLFRKHTRVCLPSKRLIEG